MAKGDAARAPRAPARPPVRPRSAARPAAVDRAASRARRRGADPRRRPGAGDRPGRELARQAMARRTLCRAGAAADRQPTARCPERAVAVLAAGHERAQAEPLLDAIPGDRRIDLVGRVDLLTAAAVLRRCALFIGNDTGLMHIAAACGTPTLGLFGPSPSRQYAPWGPRAAFVCSADPPETMFGPGFDHRTTDTLDGRALGRCRRGGGAPPVGARSRAPRREPGRRGSPRSSSLMTRSASSPIACAASVLPTRSSSCSTAAATARARSRGALPIA